MRLLINSKHHDFIDLKTFRADHDLPPEFGAALFEPKDYTGLGSIEGAGAALNTLKQAILDALPTSATLAQWMAFIPELTRLFEAQLYAINTQVGLRQVEVEFAVAGFADMCQAVVFARMRARSYGGALDFEQIYAEWLNNTVRVSKHIHTYTHCGQTWQVQMVNHIYGRVGLRLQTGVAVYYVHDSSLACPAEKYMAGLLREVAVRILNDVP